MNFVIAVDDSKILVLTTCVQHEDDYLLCGIILIHRFLFEDETLRLSLLV